MDRGSSEIANFLAPTDISELLTEEVEIIWDVEWTRWDGNPYSGTGTYSESEGDLVYQVTYSRDGGDTWLHISDDSPAEPGTVPDDASYLIDDASPGQENLTWSVPTGSFPRGSYYLRIDAFRNGAQIHYAYHQTKLFLKR